MHIPDKARMRKVIGGLLLLGMICSALASINLPAAQAGQPDSATQAGEASFTLDGVTVNIKASLVPSAIFTASAPGSVSQVATSVSWKPFREFSITAIPFGTKPGTENLPVAQAGGKSVYDDALRSDRLQQGGQVQDGATVTLFGQQVTGLRTSVELYVDGPTPVPVTIDEWVVEAGSRLWIIRASEQQPTGDPASLAVNDFSDLVLDSNTLGNPTTLDALPEALADTGPLPQASAVDLPYPTWWNGDCDYNTYYGKSGGIATYRLGAVYRGMAACGPRPYFDNAPDVLVRFFTGAWGTFEWECVELSMRYLYLQYGINPYDANGSEVVWNYTGNLLIKIPNGTVGRAPQPGDVLSYGSTTTAGHTSVVSASNVDANGNGTITIIEQNAAVTGRSILSVSNWSVQAFTTVTGWLHDKSDSGPKFSFPVNPFTWSTGFSAFNTANNHMRHTGLDLAGTDGVTPVYATADGMVSLVAGLTPQGGTTQTATTSLTQGRSRMSFPPAGPEITTASVSPWSSGMIILYTPSMGISLRSRRKSIKPSSWIKCLSR